MKVTLATWGRFHFFDLARELDCLQSLDSLHTSYPSAIVTRFGVPRSKVRGRLWMEPAFRMGSRLLGPRQQVWQRCLTRRWEQHVIHNLRPSDIFVGLSGFCVDAIARARQLGAITILERGSSHIRTQAQLLKEESELVGRPMDLVPPNDIERELAGYEIADYVLVLSKFSYSSFICHGFTPDRLLLNPLGVDLSRFEPHSESGPRRFNQPLRIINAGTFSFRKGMHYLIEAARRLDPSRFQFVQLGAGNAHSPATLLPSNFQRLPAVAQQQLACHYKCAHVFVLPTIEDGFPVVIPQAMACGLPVITTPNGSGPDLVCDGKNGFIVPIRSPNAIVEKLDWLFRNPEACFEMGLCARKTVEAGFSWKDYGRRSLQLYENVLHQRSNPKSSGSC